MGYYLGYKIQKPLLEHSRRDFCGGSRIRTGDPMLAKHVLYQLSYTPGIKKAGLVSGFVGPGRVELPTSTLSV